MVVNVLMVMQSDYQQTMETLIEEGVDHFQDF